MYIVSVGGLKLKHWTKYPRFLWITYRAHKQAKAAEGFVKVEHFRAEGCFFVVSIWDAPKSMKAYAVSGAHKMAMARASETTSEARNYYFSSPDLPTRKMSVEKWKSSVI